MRITVFFHVFRDNLYKVSQKMRKTEFNMSFLRNINVKHHRYVRRTQQRFHQLTIEAFCADVPTNTCEKTVVFSRFSMTLLRYAKFAKCAENRCFFTYVCRNYFVYKVRKKCEKQRFLNPKICATFIKSVIMYSSWIPVLRDTLYKVPAKNAKKQRFLCFLRDVLSKSVTKTVFLSICQCRDTLCQSSQKMRWTAFSWAFIAQTFLKKCEKTVFFYLTCISCVSPQAD